MEAIKMKELVIIGGAMGLAIVGISLWNASKNYSNFRNAAGYLRYGDDTSFSNASDDNCNLPVRPSTPPYGPNTSSDTIQGIQQNTEYTSMVIAKYLACCRGKIKPKTARKQTHTV